MVTFYYIVGRVIYRRFKSFISYVHVFQICSLHCIFSCSGIMNLMTVIWAVMTTLDDHGVVDGVVFYILSVATHKFHFLLIRPEWRPV